MIIDSHAHLTDEKFEGEISRIVETLPQFNIEKVICVGYDKSSSEKSVELANKFDSVYAAVGIHPHDSDKASKNDYELFAELAENPKVVAIGEIGLDYFYDLSPRDIQKKVFAEQLELADNLNLPVALHIRDAYEDARKILFENKSKLRNGFVLHCYSGSPEMAEVFQKLDGAYFSFGGSLTFKNARHAPDVLKILPREKILIETDCPYLAPVPYRGQRNEPKYINLVVERISEILSISTKTVVNLTKTNTETLFSRIKSKI